MYLIKKKKKKKVSEKDFWKRYFSSKFFHRNRTQGKSHIDTKDPIFDKCLEEDSNYCSIIIYLNKKYTILNINKLLFIIEFTGPSEEEIENVPLLIDLTATEQNQFEV